MILCPNCNKTSTELGIRGPVLIAEGVVELDDENKFIAISPLKAIQTIRVGSEVTCPDMLFICPKCVYIGTYASYKVVAACVITGAMTDFSIETFCGRISVLEEHTALAHIIFSEDNARWDASQIRSLDDV